MPGRSHQKPSLAGLFLSCACVLTALASTGCPGGSQTTSCTTDSECPYGLTCTNKTCVPKSAICQSGTLVCDGSQVAMCSADGLVITGDCAGSCMNGACVAPMCTAGTQRCSGNVLTECSADGAGYQPQTVCSIGCDAMTNTCIAATCQPGQTQCAADGTLQTCQTNGSAFTSTTCGTGSQCVTNGLTGAQMVAFCQNTSCSPGALECSGQTVLECNPAGTAQTYVTSCAAGCMNGNCVAATCTPGSVQCSIDGKSVERCNALGTGWITDSCVVNGVGACVANAGATGSLAAQCAAGLCVPNSIQCNGSTPIQCSSDGLSTTVLQSCSYGCTTNTGCVPAACSPGQTQCTGNSLQTCAPNQQSFIFSQFCENGCVAGAGTAAAACALPACAPFSQICDETQPTNILQCSPTGSGYTAVPCDEGLVCVGHSCVTPPATCVVGSGQCSNRNLQTCEAENTTPPSTSWVTTGGCLGQCSTDSCDSAGACSAFNLQVALVPAGTNLPADGESTFLVVSDLLVGPDGQPVPDGTLVSFGVTGAALLSADADPSTQQLERPVVNGRAQILIQAPLLTAVSPATVTAQIGDRAACSSSLSLTFDPTVTDAYFGEDFSTTRARQTQSPTAQWDTKDGILTLTPFDSGDGRDGPLVVATGTTVDLSTRISSGHSFADMASEGLVSASGNQIVVDGVAAPFETTGTRVLIINVQGAPGALSTVGSYEYATVIGLSGSGLELAAPLSRVYGVGGNSQAQLAGQSVRVIRVPQYSTVQVAGTLTGPAFNGTSGGVLAFFAASAASAGAGGNVVSGSGKITMHAAGYRGATQTGSGEGLSSGSLNTPSFVSGPGSSGSGYQCDDTREVAGDNGVNMLCGDVALASTPGTPPANCSAGCQHYSPTGTDQCGNFACENPATYEQPGGGTGMNTMTDVFYGSGGSHALSGNTTCGPYGAASPYGDALLAQINFGGGSGSVSRSESDTCEPQNYDAIHAAVVAHGTPPQAQYSSCCRRVDSGHVGFCCNDPNQAQGPGPDCSASVTCVGQCPGCINTNYCDAFSFQWDESFAGSNGGGIILINAAAWTMSGTSTIDVTGDTNGNASFGGAGGSLYLKVNALTLGGAGHLLAKGGPGGGDGRIRIDSATIDSTFIPGWASPAAVYQPQPSETVISNVVLTLPNTSYTMANTLLMPGTASVPTLGGAFDPTGSLAATRLSFSLTENASVFGPVLPTGLIGFTGTPPAGTQVEWELAPTTLVGSTHGIAAHFVIPH